LAAQLSLRHDFPLGWELGAGHLLVTANKAGPYGAFTGCWPKVRKQGISN
jgi:hypothetical protein